MKFVITTPKSFQTSVNRVLKVVVTFYKSITILASFELCYSLSASLCLRVWRTEESPKMACRESFY